MMNSDEQNLLQTGKIISATREIESLMAECGAVGNGLREKTESLAGKLPPEAVKLSVYIGSIRNKLAHESEPQISQEEFQLFDAAAETLLQILEELKNPAVIPPQETAEYIEEEEDETEETPVFFKTRIAGFIPLAHLVFGGELLWRSFCRGWEYLALLLAEFLGLASVIYSLWNRAFGAWFGAGTALLVFCWLISIWDKLRRADGTLPGKLALFPLANTVYFAVCLWENFVLFYFIAALALFGCMGGGICFLLSREWVIAAVCGALSYLVSLTVCFLTRGGERE
ncbi:MAG: hypothetical protein J6C40_14405 [Lentisphaeria bacterium]|nr:hypothetical protein [Lentisphaeria bacterium]